MAGMEIDHIHTSGVSDATLQTHISRISSYRDELKTVVAEDAYNSPESALSLLDDDELLSNLQSLQETFSIENLSDVVVIGMGGSARGSRAVYDLLSTRSNPTLHTIDTVSAHEIENILEILQAKKPDIDQIAICVISKSGTTTETIANANIFIRRLGEVFSLEDVRQQTVAVTQPGSQLEDKARKSDIHVLHTPEQVGGRFSVFSAAGLVPLVLAGIPVDELVSGARSLRDACLSGRPTSDPSAALAAIIYEHMGAGTRILNHYFFTPQADELGSWIRQLYAESLGKRKNNRGEPVFSGMYPVTSIAPRDLHADFQLQLGGPKNFFTIFVREQDRAADLQEKITDAGLLVDGLSDLSGRQLGDVYKSLSNATVEAFKEADRPFVDIRLPSFDPTRVGQLLLLEQLVVMYLGHLLSVNTFNQPQVETYKDIARANMEEK